MKKLLFLLLFVCSAAVGQMTRSLPFQLKGTCIQYAPLNATPKSVVIILPGIGERGTDPTIIETNIGIAKALKAGTFTVDRIVLFQQIPSTMGGYYYNTIAQLMTYANSFGLPVDFSGLSLGGMGVSLNLPFFKVRSAMTCPGKVEANKPADQYGPAIYYDSAYNKIPSIHYYSIGDATIYNGYTSIKNLVTKLKSWGKKDISLIELPGTSHNVWDYAYLNTTSGNNYWSWLDALDAPAKPDPIVSWNLINGILVGTTQLGKTINITPGSIN